MMLASLIAMPLLGGFIILFLAKSFPRSPWAFACLAMLINCGALLFCAVNGIAELHLSWLPDFGVSFHLRMDALSLLLLIIVQLMGLLAMVSSLNNDHYSPWFFGNVLWLMAGLNGVLLAADLLLFFLFWEGMIIPLYFLVLAWGTGERTRAATQFFIFTQSSGLVMLVAIVGLCFVGYTDTGIFSFDLAHLASLKLDPSVELLLLCGFMMAFLVKLPAVPFHVWLPEIFVAAPLSPILMGIMVKTGAYGILRFVPMLFPQATVTIAPMMIALGLFTLFYGALLAYAQNDVRKILAYSTISHMGLVLIALFCPHQAAQTGAIILLVTGALSTGGLLLLFAEYQCYDLEKFGGLFDKLPSLGVISLFLAMSSLGLPIFGQFVGEWLSIVGIFAMNEGVAILTALGLVLSAAYHLRLLKKLLFGKSKGADALPKLRTSRIFIYGSLIGLLLLIGLYPSPLTSILHQNNFVESKGNYD